MDIFQNKVWISKTLSDYDLWHKRLGHLSEGGIQKLQKGLVSGLPQDLSKSDKVCENCIMGKQSRTSFSQRSKGKRAKEILELVHSDLCGPMDDDSIGGAKYFMTLIDDKTRKTFVYFLRYKSEVFNVFQNFKTMVEKQTGCKIKKLRSDNGKEYVNKRMEEYLQNKGIIHQLSAPYTPEQNGVAERANRTIVEKVRSIIYDAGLEKKFWAEAVNTIVYLKNRSPTIALVNETPEEAWCKEKPSVNHLRIFGCKAFVQIPKSQRRKLDMKSTECIFVGYEENSKAYRLFDEKKKKIIISANVVFDEKQNLSTLNKQIDLPENSSEDITRH